MRAVAVIPARYGSSRFPGKPLVPLHGKPLIAWVVERARACPAFAEVVVATDHEGIAEAAVAAGARAVRTSAGCRSGTDRVAEAARALAADVVVNVQGDEPLVDPADLGALVAAMEGPEGPAMATLVRPLRDTAEWRRPDVVKVVCDAGGNALYFSRSPIPYFRDEAEAAGEARIPAQPPVEVWKHLGVYAFTRQALLAFPGLPEGRLERAERLEQLRALEAGWRIRVVEARSDSVGVDRPEDVARVEKLLAAGRQGG
ncbi:MULTISPECIES: 3-deoxy-manno-octulosonate cytidylyltransferase [Deferrisoma]